MNSTAFTNNEWLRYTRHIQLPQIGAKGQTQLKQSTVLIVGCGGLGSPVSLYLAAAGVGHLILVDGDVVDVTNLQRQILFSTQDVGHSKADRGKDRLTSLNPDIKVTAINQPFSFDNAESLVSQADLILDCTDNFATRYLINDVCAQLKKPWVFASIFQFSGQCALFTSDTACFRCLFPESPTEVPDCNAAGVLGVLPGMLGLFQANEAIKFLIGLNTPLKNTLLLVEAIDLTFRKINLSKSNDCAICAHHKTSEDLQNFYQIECASEILEDNEFAPSKFIQYENNEKFQILDVRTEAERAAFHLGGTHIALAELEHQLSQLNKQKTIVCYCQSGVRSKKAADLLTKQGFNSLSMHNGIAGWLKHNLQDHS